MIKNFTQFLFFFIFILHTSALRGQVVVGKPSLDSSAVLEVYSRSKGFLMPRVSETLLTQNLFFTDGLLLYVTDGDDKGFHFFDGNVNSWTSFEDAIPPVQISNLSIQSKNIKDNTLADPSFFSSIIDSTLSRDSALRGNDFFFAAISDQNFIPGSIHPRAISSRGASSGSTLSWSQGREQWEYFSVLGGGYNYRGNWYAGLNVPPLSNKDAVNTGVQSGTFYSVVVNGSADFGDGSISFIQGDRVIFDGSQWRRIPVTESIGRGVFTAFGSAGEIVADNTHYNINQIDLTLSSLGDITDISYSVALVDSSFLIYDGTDDKFKTKRDDYGTSARTIGPAGIDTSAITTDKVSDNSIVTADIADDSIDSTHFEKNLIDTRYIKNNTIPTSSIAPNSSYLDSSIVLYDGVNSKWSLSNVDVPRTRYMGTWDAIRNVPFLNDDDINRGAQYGDIYLATTGSAPGGVRFSRSRSVRVFFGDFVIFTPNGWERLISTGGAVSYMGRDGVIVAQTGDYSWPFIGFDNSSILRVANPTLTHAGLKDGQILTYNQTTNVFEPEDDIGSMQAPADSIHISTEALITDNIKNESIISDGFITNEIRSATVAPQGITNEVIKLNEIDNKKFGLQSVVGFLDVGDREVEGVHFLNEEVDSSHLVAEAVQTVHLLDLAIDSNALAPLSVGGSYFVANSIRNRQLDDRSIGVSNIVTGALPIVSIKDSAIEGRSFIKNIFGTALLPTLGHTKIKNTSIDSQNIGTGIVDGTHFMTEGMNSGNLKSQSITTSHIATSQIEDIHIVKESISIADLKNGDVLTPSKSDPLASRAVTSSHLVGSIKMKEDPTDTSPPKANSVLQLDHSSKGMQLPRMSTTERRTLGAAISSSEDGMMVFDTNKATPYLWRVDRWVKLAGIGSPNEPYRDVDSYPDVFSEGDHLEYNGVLYGMVEVGDLMWMDRNLGATDIAKSIIDNNGFGDYYQWGRAGVEHTRLVSTSTTRIDPRTVSQDYIQDSLWYTFSDKGVWNGLSAVNNPCPPLWRLPTRIEIETLGLARNIDAFNSKLRLPTTGYQEYSSLNVLGRANDAYLWTAEALNTENRSVAYVFSNSTADSVSHYPGQGMPVRCVHDASVMRVSSELAQVGDTLEHLGTPYAVIEYRGMEWLDRNLGADTVADSLTHQQAYGDYYQWGRRVDGHQIKTNNKIIHTEFADPIQTSDEIVSRVKNSGVAVTSITNWHTATGESSLWSGPNGVNNPCPSGWKVPSALMILAIPPDIDYAFTNLHLTSSGEKLTGIYEGAFVDEDIVNNDEAYLWTSTSIDDDMAYAFHYTKDGVELSPQFKEKRMPVRCMKVCSQQNPCLNNTDQSWITAEEGEYLTYLENRYNIVRIDDLLWIDRNIGSVRQPESFIDSTAAGSSYFQWGSTAGLYRFSTSTTTTTKPDDYQFRSAIEPREFISTPDSSWTQTPRPHLWQGTNSPNNPCPLGWRLPTSAEYASLGFSNGLDAFDSPLKLSVNGFRDPTTGSVDNRSSQAWYWTADHKAELGGAAVRIELGSIDTDVRLEQTNGLNIRCVASADDIDSRVPAVKLSHDSIFFEYLGQTYRTIEVGNRLWLDRDLEANVPAASATESNFNRGYYQWRRGTDGHQEVGGSASSAIRVANEYAAPYDTYITNNQWANAWQNPDPWQIDSHLDPCPPGWHIPTQAEFASLSISDINDGFAKIRLSTYGKRDAAGVASGIGTIHYLWSSTQSASSPFEGMALKVDNASATFVSLAAGEGLPLRCTKNK